VLLPIWGLGLAGTPMLVKHGFLTGNPAYKFNHPGDTPTQCHSNFGNIHKKFICDGELF
jgi:hypothetical protein